MHYTGDIIKELIKTGIGNDSLFDKDWDRGSRKMFYTSNPSFKMINDMNNENLIICLPTGTGKNFIIINSLKPNVKYLIMIPRIMIPIIFILS
jgi:replicative superfamily II helicase